MRIKSAVALTLFSVAALGAAPLPASAADVIVPRDVDVYDHPGGEGKPRGGMLKRGSQVDLLKQNADHWCHVAGSKDPVPGGSGWIWCGKGDDGKNYGLKPIKADTQKPVGNTGSGNIVFNCHFDGGIFQNITAKDEKSAAVQYTAWLKPSYHGEGDPPGVKCSPTTP